MLRVTVTVADPSDRIAKVTVGDQEPVVLGLSQARTFEVPDGAEVIVAEGEIVDTTVRDAGGNVVTDIGEGNHGNPNGIVSAAIAPKMPQGSGETVVERVDGRYIERTPTDPAAMRRGGGPDSEDGGTPGPQPGGTTGGTIRDPASEQGTELRAGAAGTQVAGAPKPTAGKPPTPAPKPK